MSSKQHDQNLPLAETAKIAKKVKLKTVIYDFSKDEDEQLKDFLCVLCALRERSEGARNILSRFLFDNVWPGVIICARSSERPVRGPIS